MFPYRIRTPDSDIFIAERLSGQNHTEDIDKEVSGLELSIDAVHTSTDVPACMSIQEIQGAMQRDVHLQQLKEYIINGWPESRNQIHKKYYHNEHSEKTL